MRRAPTLRVNLKPYKILYAQTKFIFLFSAKLIPAMVVNILFLVTKVSMKSV